jgi:DEAD/DEAH box helicase domain-containing protein
MFFEVFFDVETKKLFQEIATNDPGDLGVSIVSVYSRKFDGSNEFEGKMQSYWESDFPAMWSLFENADRIVGFNSLKFDVPALKPYSPPNFPKLKHFDLMDKIKDILGFRLSLNSLAKDSLGEEKIDVGTNAVLYWNQGDPGSLAKLQKYCEMDVMITRNLYDYGFKNGHVKFTDKWNNPKILNVDFSYPVNIVNNAKQIDLF